MIEGQYMCVIRRIMLVLMLPFPLLLGCNKGPSNAEFHTLKAEMYLRAGESEKAQQELDKVFSEDPDLIDGLLLQSRLFTLNNEIDKSIDVLVKAENVDYKNLDVLYSLGFVYSQKGDYSKAIETYRKAIEVKPDTALGYNNIAVVYHSKKDYQNAVKNYKKAIELNEKFIEAHYNLGNTYSMKGELENAIKHYNKAVEIKPEYTDPYIELSAVYNKLGNKSEAGNNVGLYYFWRKQYDQAIKAFNDVIATNPEYAVAYNNLAVCYDKIGNSEQSVINIKKSAKLGYAPAIEICKKNNISF